MKVLKWKLKYESESMKVLKWIKESESMKVQKWKYEYESMKAKL